MFVSFDDKKEEKAKIVTFSVLNGSDKRSKNVKSSH